MTKQKSAIFMFTLLIGLSKVWADNQAVNVTPDAQVPGRGHSVYRIQPWIDGPVLGAAALGSVLPLVYESRLIHPPILGDSHDINSIDRTVIGNHNKTVGYISHVEVALAIAVPIVLDMKDVGWNKTLTEDFVVYSEVLALNTSISNAARYSMQRPRPDVYRAGANVNDPGEFLSFYSGHVASTMAALSAASMTYNYRYGNHAWPWVVTFLAGATEAVERSAAGRHFPSDNLVGAILGTTIGVTVPFLHHRKSPNHITLAPEDHGAQLVWRRKF